MSGFDDIKIGWKGAEYKVPSNRCFGLLARIEEVLAPAGSGLNAIDLLSDPRKAHLTKLVMAYGVALRYAGATVTDEEIYLSVSQEITKGGSAGFQGILTLSHGLLFMFFPDWAKNEPLAEDDGAASVSGNLTGAAGDAHSKEASSGRFTKSPLGADG